VINFCWVKSIHTKKQEGSKSIVRKKNYHRTKFIALIFSLILASIPYFPNQAVAATTSQTIRFSNIGGGTGDTPTLSYSTTVTGLNIDGKTMVKLSDIANILGASISYNPYDPSEWRLTRNGSMLKFWEGSTSFSWSNNYNIYYPATGSTKTHSLAWGGTSDHYAGIINSTKYVRATTAANQLGSLMIAYDSTSGEVRIFDWRVYGTTPVSDSNDYVVGGPWFSSWSTYYYDDPLTDHFIPKELWDKSSSTNNPKY
jgi:hypothetical protein